MNTSMMILPTLRRLLSVPLLLLLTGCSTHAHTGGSDQAAFPKGGLLRLMPLGDSITRGSGSGYGNYRRPLQSLLARGTHTFQFVGTNTEQSFNYHGPDPEQTFNPYQPGHEGYGGFRIDQIAGNSPATDDGGVSYPGLSRVLATDKPDIILLMLGTNDVNQGYDPGGPGYRGSAGFAADAAARLDALIDKLMKSHPRLTLVVATIPPLADPVKDRLAQAYNVFIPQIVAARRKQGQHILFTNMHAGLTLSDMSPDGIHPVTAGYDKMARLWYKPLTGQAPPPPLFESGAPTSPPGRLGQPNVFRPTDQVTVSNSFDSPAFVGSQLVDGTDKAFVFGDARREIVSISGFRSAIQRLRFFDTPSYTGRTPTHVTVYSSTTKQTSLNPKDYALSGTFPLPVVGDTYTNQTTPAAHPDAGDPASHPAAVISFTDLNDLHVPADTQSILLDFSKGAGDGDGLTEIQAFAPTARP